MPARFDPRPVAALAALSLALGLSAQPDPGVERWGAAELAGLITDPALDEVSGLAVSHRHRNVIWVHNDGGSGAHLYAISGTGARLARIRVAGVANTDWEDLAGFELDGRHYLLIADTGDNGGLRQTLQLHVVPEPEAVTDGEVTPAWSIEFRWPDGPRDCEAVAVDATRGEILLVGKKRVPPDLFRLPLRPSDAGVLTAEPIGHLSGITQPTPEQVARSPRFGRFRAQISGADIRRDGRHLAILNYQIAYVYERAPGQDWGEATARAPIEVPYPWQPQAEAIGFDAEGALWIASERRPTPLLRLSRIP